MAGIPLSGGLQWRHAMGTPPNPPRLHRTPRIPASPPYLPGQRRTITHTLAHCCGARLRAIDHQEPAERAMATSTAPAVLSPPSVSGLRLAPSPRTARFLRAASPAGRRSVAARAELSPSLVISLSTGVSLFLGRFVFFNFQRENVAKQVPAQNGKTHFEAGDERAKEYAGLLKSNDPVGFNLVDVLAWGSLGHIVAYYILATSSNGYDPNFF